MRVVLMYLPKVALANAEVMESKGLGSSEGSVGVMNGKLDIARSQGSRKPLWLSAGGGLRDNVFINNASEPTILNLTSDAESLLSNGQASSFLGSSGVEEFALGTSKSSLSQVSGGKQLNRRSGKVGGSSGGGSKRSRIAQMEVSRNETGAEDVNEKPQITRQKSIANGKQRDKRNTRLPKSKADPFPLKNGLVSFSSVSGGGNLLAYGCKSNNFDFTKHVHELPLDELLDGSSPCHSLVEDKEKAFQCVEDNLLNSVRKACSVLRFHSPVRTQNTGEIDHNYEQKPSTCLIMDGASPENRTNEGSGGCRAVNQPSINKDCCARTKELSIIDDSPLYEPKDILQLLMLPPPKDLDTLLVDASKPPSSSKINNNIRLGKTVSHQTGLPPFPWSFNPPAHSKSGPDSVKLTANRPSCHGRWVKVENTLISPKESTGFSVDFEPPTYDHRLVPTFNNQSGSLEKEIAASLTSYERAVSSSAACTAPQVPLADHSSGAWAAAETLYEIASSSKDNMQNDVDGLEKSQMPKPMNTSKLKLDEESVRLVTAPAPPMCSGNLRKNPVSSFPSKRLKLAVDGNAENVSHASLAMKGPINWSTPRTFRSSTGNLSRESVPQTDHPRCSNAKKSYMMPLPSRTMDKASRNKPKVKETLQRETNS